jgi:hypothetical protein
MSAQGKIAAWFWGGVAGVIAGLLAMLLVWWEGYSEDTFIVAVALALAGWSAMLVGVIGKGVQLGVRAANDE